MMESVDCRTLDNLSNFCQSNLSTVGGIALQRLVRSPRMVVIQVRRKQSLEVALVYNDDMVEEFSAKATDYAFNIRVGVSCQLHPMQPLNTDLSGSPTRSIRYWGASST